MLPTIIYISKSAASYKEIPRSKIYSPGKELIWKDLNVGYS